MGEGDNEANRILWVGNLHERVTEELLYELFVQAGPLQSVKLPKGRNYSFITFKHEVSVPYTLELMEGVELFGRRLKLQFRSQPNTNNPMSGSPNPCSPMDAHGFQRSFSTPNFPNNQPLIQQPLVPMMMMQSPMFDQPLMQRNDTYPSQRRSRFDESPHNSPYSNSPYDSPSHGDNRHQRDDRRLERMQNELNRQLGHLQGMDSQQRFQQIQRGQGQQPWQQQQQQQQHHQGRRGYY